MAQKTGTPVAESEPAAPPAEVQAQVPPESPPEQVQSESGQEEATKETGADPLAVLGEFLKDPAQANRLFQMVPEDVRNQTDVVKDIRGRAEQGGERRAFHKMEAEGKDLQALEDAKTDRDQAFKDLASDDIDVATRSRHANAIQTATEAIHDGNRKRESLNILNRALPYEDYREEDHERLSAVDGKSWDQWLSERVAVALDVKDRLAYARGLAEGQKAVEADRTLREGVAAVEGRPGAPATTPAGTPAGSLSFEQLEHLFATGEATPDQTNAYIAERHRRGIIT